MNRQNEQPDNPFDPIGDDQLDQLLASAKVPSNSRKQKRAKRKWLNRLLIETRPKGSSLWSRNPFTSRPAWAFVCSVFLLIGASLVFWPPGEDVKVGQNPNDFQNDVQPNQDETNQQPRKKSRPKNRKRIRGYLTTTIENSLLTMSTSDFGLRVLNDFVRNLDQVTQVAKLNRDKPMLRRLSAANRWRNQTEARLVKNLRTRGLPSNNVERLRRSQNIKLLSRIAGRQSRQSLAVLLNFLPVREVESDILFAAMRNGDAKLLGRLALAARGEVPRDRLLAELLSRNDRESFLVYLNVVQELDSFVVVQRSSLLARSLPSELVIEALLSNRNRLRRIAATILSVSRDPKVSEILVHLASQPRSSRAAILALSGRSDPISLRFVRSAGSNVRFSALVRNAKTQWVDLKSSTQTVASLQFNSNPSNP